MRFSTRIASAGLLVVLWMSPAFCLPLEEARQSALAYLNRWQIETGAPGVSAAVAVDGRIVFAAGVGTADLESGAAQSSRTVHNIGSVSKAMAVVAVMQLAQKQRLRLDAPIQESVPWFPRKGAPITLRQILTHTSGVRHYREGEFGPGDVLAFRHYENFEESTRSWREEALVFEPGSHWLYSSFATALLQAVIEKASGEPFEHYMRTHVWEPAGMADTRLDSPTRVVPRRGRGYERDSRTGVIQKAAEEDVSYKYASGGMLSTDEDLCRFGVALNEGRLLGRKEIAEMYRLQLPVDLPSFNQEPMGGRQALIFVIDHDAAGRVYAGHSGSVKGTGTYFTNYYQDHVVVAIHFNLDGVDRLVEKRRANEVLAQLFFP